MMHDNYPHCVVTRGLTIREYGEAVAWCMENLTKAGAIYRSAGSQKLVRVGRIWTTRLTTACGWTAHLDDLTNPNSTGLSWANPRTFYFRSIDDATLFQLKYA